VSELPTTILQKLTPSELVDALIKASCQSEDAFSAANPLPLTKWPESLVQRTAAVAGFYALKAYGFAGGGIDDLIVKAYDDAQAWLKSVATRKIELAGVEPKADPDTRVSSGDPRNRGDLKPRMSDNWGDY
jgi:phage gp36-like protein